MKKLNIARNLVFCRWLIFILCIALLGSLFSGILISKAHSEDKVVSDAAEETVVESEDINEVSAEEFYEKLVDEAVTVNSDGTIPEDNGELPIMVKGLFGANKAPAKTSSHLESAVMNVMYNDLITDITIEMPDGRIDENEQTEFVQQQEEEKLHPNATYLRAIYKSGSAEYEIANIGTYENALYYSLKGNDEDTGIKLQAGENVYLVYRLYYDVTYVQATGGIGTGNEVVAAGQPLTLSYRADDYYDFVKLTYNIVTGYDDEGQPTSYKYGTAQDVPQTNVIPASEITGDVYVYASFTRHSSYVINAPEENVQHGHVCGECSKSYSDSHSGDVINAVGNLGTGTMKQEHHAVTVSSGGTAYLTLYQQKGSGTGAYFLNAIWLNGEEVKVPTQYTVGATNTTVLSNGTVVTVTLESTEAKDSHLVSTGIGSNPANVSRYLYIIKIEDVKEDIVLSTYFRPYYKTNTYLKGLRGIASTAAAYPIIAYERWVEDPLFHIGNLTNTSGINIFYFLDENNSTKDFPNMYKSYNKSNMQEYFNENRTFAGAVFSLGHQFGDPDVHFHNIYLAKVSPGYNPNTIQYTNLLGNYTKLDSVLNASTLFTDSHMTSQNVFFNAINDKETDWSYSGGYTGSYGGQQCRYNEQIQEVNILGTSGHELVAGDSYNIVKNYSPFLQGALSRLYKNGIAIDELSSYNNSLEINASTYKYRIEYYLNEGQIKESIDQSKYDTSDLENEKFEERNRHAIEIVRNMSYDSSEQDEMYEQEFANVEGNLVTLAHYYPSRQADSQYTYSFKGWRLVKYNNSTGQYESTNDTTIYKPGETFTINKSQVGYDLVRASSAYSNYDANLSDYDVYSGNINKGNAWGDGLTDDSMTFTFQAEWEAIPIGDRLSYSVLAYKNVLTDDVQLDDEDKPIYEMQNGVKYYLYYKNTNNKAAPETEIISLNQHYPTDGKKYTLNDDLTDEKIDCLVTQGYIDSDPSRTGLVVDDTIKYYYDVAAHDVVISEATEGLYANTQMAFPIDLILVDSDNFGITADVELTGDLNGTLHFDNGSLDAASKELLKLSHEQSVTLKDIPNDATLTVTPSSNDYYTSTVSNTSETSSDNGRTGVINDDGIVFSVIYTRNEVTDSGIIDSPSNTISLFIPILAALLAALAGYGGKRKRRKA